MTSRDEAERAASPVSGTVQYLELVVSGEAFALPILRVVEIVAYVAPSRVPNAPPFLHGVVAVRGSVVPVIDLARIFGFGATPIRRRSCIVLCEIAGPSEATIVGLLTESVTEVADVGADAIAPPPAIGAPVRAAFLVGLYPMRERFVFILDIDRVLSESELASISGVGEELAAPPLASAPEESVS